MWHTDSEVRPAQTYTAQDEGIAGCEDFHWKQWVACDLLLDPEEYGHEQETGEQAHNALCITPADYRSLIPREVEKYQGKDSGDSSK